MYRDILDDIEWHSLDPQSSKVLVMCWLIASENEGRLPDMKTLAFRLRMSEKNTSESIIKLSHWLEQDDIGVISERYQDDLPETERETEKEKRQKATVVACPPDVGLQEWEDWLALRKAKKAPVTETVVKSARKESEKAGISFNAFLTIWCARGSQGLQADWLKPQERQTYAQQVADIARITVPGKQERDPALVKLDQDKMITKPPSMETLQKIAQLRSSK